MLRMVFLLELPLDMPAGSPTNFATFRRHNCQTSPLMAFALFFCVAPFLGTGLPLRSPCCIRHIAASQLCRSGVLAAYVTLEGAGGNSMIFQGVLPSVAEEREEFEDAIGFAIGVRAHDFLAKEASRICVNGQSKEALWR